MKDCPVCDAENSMKPFEESATINIANKKRVSFENLSGYKCSICGEAFYDEASKERINEEVRKVNRIGIRG